MRRLGNIFRLGVKELYSFRHDTVMLFLVIYSFSFGVYSAATGVTHDLHNAAIAIVDEDGSQLSARLKEAFLPPYFQRAEDIGFHEIDQGMDSGRYSFVVVIPPRFEANVLAGRKPAIQVDIDATAMSQAGIGDGYISRILTEEIAAFTADGDDALPVELETRFAFNPNLTGCLVRRCHGDHQQRHRARDHSRWRRPDPRARARHHRASPGHADRRLRDHDGQSLGEAV